MLLLSLLRLSGLFTAVRLLQYDRSLLHDCHRNDLLLQHQILSTVMTCVTNHVTVTETTVAATCHTAVNSKDSSNKAVTTRM